MKRIVSRDHSIQEWIDLTYKPYDGSGISKQITDLLAQLGRTPPPPGMKCPTKTNRTPHFAHKLHVSETHPIPRDQAIRALTLMNQEQDPNKKLFFAALEVAMQLNCWTVPDDIRAVVHKKGWMQSVAGSPAAQTLLGASPPASNPAPRSINEEDDVDILARNALEDDSLDTELYSRDADAEADAMFDLWIREADAEADADADADAKAASVRFLGKR